MKNKRVRNLFSKSLAALLIIAFSCMATPFLDQEFVTALADSGTSDTNVAYLEGMAPNMSDFEIHTATRMSAKSSENPAITFFVHGQNGNASHWSNIWKLSVYL